MNRKSGIILFMLILVKFSVFAGPLDSIGVTKINNKLHVRYMVSPGETIYGISTKYGVSVADLLELNPEMENGLKVGQVLSIPYNPENIKVTKKHDDNTITHKVQQGETFYGISKKYNISLNELMKMNNMDLKAGQEIIVGYKDQAKANSQVAEKPISPAPTTATPAATKPVEEKKENVVIESKSEEKITVAEKPAVTTVPPAAKEVVNQAVNNIGSYPYDPTRKQVLVIPFDPYLYFSDADDEIAAKSNMPRTKVRQIFRKRLNALIDAPGYETIRLLGGKAKDSISDMNKIYSMVTYNYQQVVNGPYYKEEPPEAVSPQRNKTWLEKQKEKLTPAPQDTKYDIPKDHGSFFGVVIKNPEFFNYFNEKYSVDYYIFVSQFEVKTNYENCLDRAALNYERTFTTHFSIFDNTGKQIAGNKFKTHYNSNSNYIYQIVSDNMDKIAKRIIAELPPPDQQ